MKQLKLFRVICRVKIEADRFDGKRLSRLCFHETEAAAISAVQLYWQIKRGGQVTVLEVTEIPYEAGTMLSMCDIA